MQCTLRLPGYYGLAALQIMTVINAMNLSSRNASSSMTCLCI
jgi:hypothetical protein